MSRGEMVAVTASETVDEDISRLQLSYNNYTEVLSFTMKGGSDYNYTVLRNNQEEGIGNVTGNMTIDILVVLSEMNTTNYTIIVMGESSRVFMERIVLYSLNGGGYSFRAVPYVFAVLFGALGCIIFLVLTTRRDYGNHNRKKNVYYFNKYFK